MTSPHSRRFEPRGPGQIDKREAGALLLGSQGEVCGLAHPGDGQGPLQREPRGQRNFSRT